MVLNAAEFALQVGGRSVQSHILLQGVVAAETASLGRSAASMCLGISRLQQALHCKASQAGERECESARQAGMSW